VLARIERPGARERVGNSSECSYLNELAENW